MRGPLVSLLLILLSGVFYQCESPCTQSVSQSQISAVDQTKLQEDIETIDAYLVDHSITAIEDPSGMRYTIDIQGTGSKPCLENNVNVKYWGTLLSNGTQFDGSSIPVSFKLNNLILGWKIVLPKIQGGSTVTLYIPSGFGYGTRADIPGIPANSNLVFKIELIK